MAQDIVSSILNAQGIDPLDLVDDGSFDQSSDSDGDSAEPSPSNEKPNDIRSRVQRVGVFNFGTDRVRVLEKTSGSGSGTDRVRVLALHFYHSGIIGYQRS